MAKISKSEKDFNIYRLECSFGELTTIQKNLAEKPEPVADDLAAAIDWYLENEVPPPGVSKEDFKAKREAGELPREIGGEEGAPGEGGEEGGPAQHEDSVNPLDLIPEPPAE